MSPTPERFAPADLGFEREIDIGDPFLKLKSRYTSWRLGPLLRRVLTEPRYQDSTTWSGMLWGDFKTFVSEFVKRENKVRLSPYIVSQNHITSPDYEGIDLGVMAHNFIPELAAKGGRPERAKIEAINPIRVKQWAIDQVQTMVADVATKLGTTDPETIEKYIKEHHFLERESLIWASPPGTEKMGYLGTTSAKNWKNQEKFPSMIYIYTLGDFTVGPNLNVENIEINNTLLTGWPNYHQLMEFQAALGQAPTVVGGQDAAVQIIGNLIRHRTNHRPNDGQSYRDAIETEVENLFYLSEAKWKTDRTSAPILDQAEVFETKIKLTFEELYFPQMQELLLRAQAEYRAMGPAWFKQDSTKKLIAECDQLFEVTERYLRREVQVHDANPVSQELAKREIGFFQKLALRLRGFRLPDPTKQEIAPEVPISDLQFAFHTLTKAKIDKLPLTKEEAKWLMNSLPGLIAMGSAAASLMQCGFLTPFTLPFSILKQASSGHELLVSLQSAAKDTNRTVEEKELELKTVRGLNYVELDLRNAGAPRVYMVPSSYLEQGGCYVKNGKVYGPCDIAFDDPVETLALPMDKTEFAAYVKTLEQSVAETELNKTTSEVLKKLPDPTQQQRLKELIQIIRNQLFKSSVSVSELISGDVTKSPTIAALLPLLRRLRHAGNPIQELEKIISTTFIHIGELMPKSPLQLDGLSSV